MSEPEWTGGSLLLPPIAAAVDRIAETYAEGISDQILTLNGFRW